MSTANTHPTSEHPDEFHQARLAMVSDQLRRRGICDERVLEAMRRVPRHEFVPPKWRHKAYADSAIPLDYGQTVSQPYTVAFMCQLAKLQGTERVLEVGTGSGYGAAVLSELAAHVYSVERVPQLAAAASHTLERVGIDNVEVRCADGALGLPDAAPFDAIVVTAGAVELPKPYEEQLVDGGRIVIPIGDDSYGQTMYRFTLEGHNVSAEDFGGFAFVPLVGGKEAE